ncbi:isoprenoid synthase domain-containing protein [Collybia nuda]|uniref:Isoprenoid synthase domain-containing protein n=1 Tax=Collybia nuda TaxID=64659 RepID=A0A9P5Y9A8_9AGAR|nr:isoprenoid synthase domain-containing protein [Collybia nuda]
MTEKINIALYTWFIIYVDDTSSKNVGPFSVFTQRFLNRLPQLDPVLDALVETLSRMCELYDTQTANYILAATFNYVHATCLETEIQAGSLMRGVVRFPWFFRDHSGLSIAFALMLFPKSKGLCFIDYVQVLEDMNFWTSGVNDILSFHKEELVGEKGNYVHNRSYVEDKAPSKVLTEICQEVLVSRKTIYAAFSHVPRAKEIWAAWELGYIRWHLIQDRYKLATLNL